MEKGVLSGLGGIARQAAEVAKLMDLPALIPGAGDGDYSKGADVHSRSRTNPDGKAIAQTLPEAFLYAWKGYPIK